MRDVAIRVENLGKRYRIGVQSRGTLADTLRILVRNRQERDKTIWALKDVSFEVEHGEVLGIIGRNGAGKSTLLRILSRITEPTEGRAEIYGRVGSLLEVGTGFHPELTGRENVYLNGAILGMRRTEIDGKFDEIVDFSGIGQFLDTPVKRYSSGMRVRLAFAVAAHLEPEILLVDEVLAVGDLAFQKKCLGKMENVAHAGRTVLFVSHNMGAVRNLCKKAIWLDNGVITSDGGTNDVVDLYEQCVLSRQDVGMQGVILPQLTAVEEGDCRIEKIEMLTVDGQPLPVLHTWDSVRFRIHYNARVTTHGATVALDFYTLGGMRVLKLTSGPYANSYVDLSPGKAFLDCVVPRFPLSAGSFMLGGKIALPSAGYAPLFEDASIGVVQVQPSDVYGTGKAPESAVSLLATEHYWEGPYES